jgi:hypothetical protein
VQPLYGSLVRCAEASAVNQGRVAPFFSSIALASRLVISSARCGLGRGVQTSRRSKHLSLPLEPWRRYPCRHYFWGGRMHNKSIDTDPQQQEAASPQVLVVRSSLR